jgi:isopentenyl-diphosphate delta-isomerase
VSTSYRDDDSIVERKAKHLEICTDSSRFDVEGSRGTGFELLHPIHQALPELALEDIDTSIEFLGYRLNAPLLISCMTGGSNDGHEANRTLAKAAQHLGLPVGMGSIRILLEKPDLLEHFMLKDHAPDVPVLANLGIAQLKTVSREILHELLVKLNVDALVLHLNPGQEMIQTGGDTDYSGLKSALASYCKESSLPVIVKETGFGMTPGLVHEMLSMGVEYVDIAGAGGTNWILVESYRESGHDSIARDFSDWGLPTAIILGALQGSSDRIIASGGIRSSGDIFKSIVLGARLAGLALPLIRDFNNGGYKGLVQSLEEYVQHLGIMMALSGCKNVDELRKIDMIRDPLFSSSVEQLRTIHGREES